MQVHHLDPNFKKKYVKKFLQKIINFSVSSISVGFVSFQSPFLSTHKSFDFTSEIIRPQPLPQCDDDEPASVTDRSFVNWVLRKKLVRVRLIENLLMFFRSLAFTNIVEIWRLEQSYRDSIVTQWGHRFTRPDSA
jgi:hypothetical protein